ncbi:MAG TPA: ABC transporter permease [Streptosporangiaceae bacterium]
MSTLSLPLRGTAPRAAFGQIVLNEARLAWRQPVGLVGGLGLPIVLLVVFNLIPTFHHTSADLGGLTAFGVYVPILIVFSLAMIALMVLPIPLVTYRELGVLRRLSTTPVPPSWLLAAQGVIQLCVAVTGSLVILIAGVYAFGAPAPKNPGGLVLSLVLSIAGLFPLGLLIASVSRTTNGAGVIGRLAFFPLIFFAGLWWPRELMPGALQVVSEATPLGAAVEAIQDSMQGQFPPAVPLLILVAYAVVFGFAAKRFFRWE